MNSINKEDLISICVDAVVPFQKWNNRDSYYSQLQIQDIYRMLHTNSIYTIKQDGDTYLIDFEITKEIYEEYRENNYYLNIDDRDDYLEENPDSEMFIGYGLDVSDESIGKHVNGYFPTRKRLIEVDGEDWY